MGGGPYSMVLERDRKKGQRVENDKASMWEKRSSSHLKIGMKPPRNNAKLTSMKKE